jgi:hypothetical protein
MKRDSTNYENPSPIGQRVPENRRKYEKISNDVRKELIRRVIEEKSTIKHASVQLGVKYSSAKSIIKIYEKTGRESKLDSQKESIWMIVVQGEPLDHVFEVKDLTIDIETALSSKP